MTALTPEALRLMTTKAREKELAESIKHNEIEIKKAIEAFPALAQEASAMGLDYTTVYFVPNGNDKGIEDALVEHFSKLGFTTLIPSYPFKHKRDHILVYWREVLKNVRKL